MSGCRTLALLLVVLSLSPLGPLERGVALGAAQDPGPPAVEKKAAPAGQAPEDGDLSDDLDQVVKGHVQRADAALSRGDHASAIEELRTAYQMDPQPELLLKAADAYRRSGQPKEAAAMYETFLKKEPGHPRRAEAEAALRELQRKREDKVPVWKKGWFWGVLAGSVVVVGAGIGIGLALGLRSGTPIEPGM